LEFESKNEIIIDFTETEISKLDNSGNVKSINLTGEISLINPSNSRIWNTKLILTGMETTNLENSKYVINELKPDKKWIHAYSMSDDLIKQPILSISEVIDTYYESDAQNWAGILGKRSPTAFKLIVENTSDSLMKNIEIIKKLPNCFSEPILEESNIFGTLSYDPTCHEVIWKIDCINPKEVRDVTIRTGFTPESNEPQGAGPIFATYEVENLIRTNLDAKIEANTDHLFAVDIGECIDNPGNWECTGEFENSSNLNVILNKIKIFLVKENIQELIVEESPNILIEPGDSWAKDFEVKSEKIPKFKKDYEFNVNYIIKKKIIGKISMDENLIPIISINVRKEMVPNEIFANTKNDVNIITTIINTGSATLNEFIIKDTIPNYFKPPERGSIEYFIDSQEIKENISYELIPDNTDPNQSHILTHYIRELGKTIKGLQPNSKLVIKYPINAWNPPPKKEYKCSIEVLGNVFPPGPPIKVESSEYEITVKYVQRKIRAFKQIQPLEEEGHYKIPVVFQNKGEIVLENIILKDFIPKNFDLINWEPEDIKPEIKDLEEGTQLIWRFPLVQPNEKLNLGYTIKGKGEYIAPELEYQVE